MASNLNEILGRNIDSVKSLKSAIKELQDSMVGLDTDSQEYKDTASKLSAAQNALNNTTKAGIEANLAAKDSIVGMQKEYNNLYDAYKKLSDEQRNSDIGKSMAESLSNLSESINNSKKEVGNFTSNIGHYAEGATEAFNQMGISVGALQTPMKLAAGGAKALGASLKALIANPVGAVIMAIVVAFKAFQAIAERVKQAIQGNEETQNRLTEAMSVFRPVLDGISNAFDWLAEKVVKVIEGFSKVAEKVMSIIPGMKKAIDSHKDLAKATNDLTKAERENSVILSQKQSEVETLRAEAAAATDATEKQQLLEEAKAKQMEIDQEYVNMAQEELRIMEEYAAKTANDAEANDKLAAAQKKVNDAIATGQKHQKEYNEQLKATTNEIKTQTSAVEDNREEAKKLYEQLVEDSKDEITQLTEKYKKEKKLLEKYHLDTKLLTKKYNRDIAKIESEAAKARVENRKEQMDRELDDDARHFQNQQKLTKGEFKKESNRLTDIQSTMISVMTEFENLSKDETFGNLFARIFNEGNYDMIGSLEYAIQLMPELKDELEALGPDGFNNLSSNLQRFLGKLQSTHGITIKNLQDFRDNEKILNQEIEDFSNKTVIGAIAATQKEEAEVLAKNTANYYTSLLYKMEEALGENGSHYDFIGQFMTNLSAATEYQTRALKVGYESLIEKKGLLEGLMDDELLSAEAKMALLEEYNRTVEEIASRQQELYDLDKERTSQMVDNLIGWGDGMASVLSTIQSSYESFIDSQLKAGYIDEQEARKKKERLQKLEKWQTNFSIATIAADAAAGIFSIWKGYSTEVGVINAQTAAAAGVGAAGIKAALDAKSLVSAISKSASLAGTAIAQITAASNGRIVSNNNFAAEGGSVGGGVGATPALMDSTPYQYTRTIQTTEEEDRLNAPIFVTVTDIEEGLAHRATVTNESSF